MGAKSSKTRIISYDSLAHDLNNSEIVPNPNKLASNLHDKGMHHCSADGTGATTAIDPSEILVPIADENSDDSA